MLEQPLSDAEILFQKRLNSCGPSIRTRLAEFVRMTREWNEGTGKRDKEVSMKYGRAGIEDLLTTDRYTISAIAISDFEGGKPEVRVTIDGGVEMIIQGASAQQIIDLTK